eukprot:Clim_evm45s251 gene=Clim_evmTU45s251
MAPTEQPRYVSVRSVDIDGYGQSHGLDGFSAILGRAYSEIKAGSGILKNTQSVTWMSNFETCVTFRKVLPKGVSPSATVPTPYFSKGSAEESAALAILHSPAGMSEPHESELFMSIMGWLKEFMEAGQYDIRVVQVPVRSKQNHMAYVLTGNSYTALALQTDLESRLWTSGTFKPKVMRGTCRMVVPQQVETVHRRAEDVGIEGLVYSPQVLCWEKYERLKLPRVDGKHLAPSERELVEFLDAEPADATPEALPWINNMRRRVKHFGYGLDYTTRRIVSVKDLYSPSEGNKTGLPEGQSLPAIFRSLLTSLAAQGVLTEEEVGRFNQITVNEYPRGEGIHQHSDLHSVYGDTLLVVSLLSTAIIAFRKPTEGETGEQTVKHLFLEPGSAVVMRGESRFGYTHGIPLRKADYVDGLRLERGDRRISIIFREVLLPPRDCDCAYPQCCDARGGQYGSGAPLHSDVNTTTAPTSSAGDGAISKAVPFRVHEAETVANGGVDLPEVERIHVLDFYESSAEHFSRTRHSPWPAVQEYMANLAPYAVVLDAGCGNGRHLKCLPGGEAGAKDFVPLAGDISLNLAGISAGRGFFGMGLDHCNMNLRSNVCDHATSIAVLHHISTPERRLQALQELVRVLKVGGDALITVWAIEQDQQSRWRFEEKDMLVPWMVPREMLQENPSRNNETTKPSGTSGSSATSAEEREALAKAGRIKDFVKDPTGTLENANKVTLQRYCHLFEEGELEGLCRQLPNVELMRVFYDRSNWCVHLRKTVNA